MRDLRALRVAALLGSMSASVGVTVPAVAQVPPAPSAAPAPQPAVPPAAPVAPVAPLPPGAIALPPGAAPPPGAVYVYPPPPGYAYPQYEYARPMRVPESVPYNGGPVPPGYHVETRQRRGLIISGALLTGIPWAIGLSIASGENFPNSSGWLVLPGLGPWLTLASRRNSNCSNSGSDDCITFDPGVRTVLVLDGLMQTAGAVLFIAGVASPYKVMARDFVGNVRFTPAPIGRQGYGGFLTGEF